MAGSYRFRSRGPSAWIESVRQELTRVANPKLWKIGGDSSLIAVHRPSTGAIEGMYGRGLKAQIWMERPLNGQGRCKFEVAFALPRIDTETNRKRRESIAASMRSHMVSFRVPTGLDLTRGSTVVAVRMTLPAIKAVRDDTQVNATYYQHELAKVGAFVHFLETALKGWRP